MQGACRRCRWCCRKPGNEPHHFPFSNEEIRHLCEAICLIRSPPPHSSSHPIGSTVSTLSTSSTLAVSTSKDVLLKIQRFTLLRVWCAPCLITSNGKKEC